jgi:hypothetical protein
MELALVVLAMALVLAAVARSARNRSWRRVAERLYAGNAALWESEQRWMVVESADQAPSRAGDAESSRRELEALGFSFLGRIQHVVDTPDGSGPVMAVFLADGGDIWAASYEVDGREVVDLESAFSDGGALGTSNADMERPAAWPPGFDMRHEASGAALSSLLAEHRKRLGARGAAGAGSTPVRCATLEELLSLQKRQQAAKQAFRRSCDFMTDEEIRYCAAGVRLSRSAAEGVLREYRRIAQEERLGRAALPPPIR